MALNIPIKSVVNPTHVQFFALADLNSEARVMIEVYSGWITVEFSAGEGTAIRELVKSFLPIESLKIREYDPQLLQDVAVVATTSSVTDDDDEENIAAVDRATVKLEPQVFGGVAGMPNVLVLRVALSALNANIHSIAYHVTVRSLVRQIQPLIELDPDTRPA